MGRNCSGIHKVVQSVSGNSTFLTSGGNIHSELTKRKMDIQILVALIFCVGILSTKAAPLTSSTESQDLKEPQNKTIFEYDLKVKAENGETLIEKLEINTKARTELVKVPKHGLADEFELLEDYSKNLTAIHVKAKNTCYVHKMISAALPDKFTQNLGNQSIVEDINDTIAKVESTSWKIDAVLTQRFLLGEKMAVMCARSSIYWLQKIEGTLSERQTRATGHARNRRSSCSTSQYCVTLWQYTLVTVNGITKLKLISYRSCTSVTSC